MGSHTMTQLLFGKNQSIVRCVSFDSNKTHKERVSIPSIRNDTHASYFYYTQ